MSIQEQNSESNTIKNNVVIEEEKKESKLNDVPFDPDLVDKQHEAIRKEIEEDSPLISDILPLEMLEFEFSDNAPFLIKIRVWIFFFL